jgi:hypothetical protein
MLGTPFWISEMTYGGQLVEPPIRYECATTDQQASEEIEEKS